MIALVLAVVFFTASLYPQTTVPPGARLVGGPCEGCEAVFEYGGRVLSPIDTLPGFDEHEPKLAVTGTVYQADGETPAPGVILYIHHTNGEGVYPTRGDERGWARRHGYIRGWVETGQDGRYTLYTTRPGTYPSRAEPAHIHITVLEPDGSYYYLDSCYFADDPQVTDRMKQMKSARGGGSGVLTLEKEGGLLVGRRDIILGANIRGYE